MIKIYKPIEPPKVLIRKAAETAFQKLIDGKHYPKKGSMDSIYKGKSGKTKKSLVREQLDQIYHKKCVYCEKDIRDDDRAIEHYRPKGKNEKPTCKSHSGYYWLAFSWDNLLLVCNKCNNAKGSCFDIKGNRAVYSGESLLQTHSSCIEYDKIEQPLIFNPEREDPGPYLQFDPRGNIHSIEERMAHTIKVCRLDREELIDKRFDYLSLLKDTLKEAALPFQKNSDKSDTVQTLNKEEIIGIKERIKLVITQFHKGIKPQNEFQAWRQYIIDHYDEFLYWSEKESPHNYQDFNNLLRIVVGQIR